MIVRVRARDAVYEFPACPGERVLHAGLRAGVCLPYECGSGTCGKCKAFVIEGTVEDHWPGAPGRRNLTEGTSEFLMCQCSAVEELTIGLPRGSPGRESEAPLADAFHGVLGQSRSLAPDVASFVVELDRPCPFVAGQFVLLRVPGIPGFRAYSMCNHEDSPRRLEFLIKRKPGGGFSDWLFSDNRDGAGVELFGPLGGATFEPSLKKSIACIAGGSGIAGMMSILSCASAEGHFARYSGYVFFGIRTLDDGFFLDRLSEHAQRWPAALSVVVALSDEAVPDHARRDWPTLDFAQGWVHDAARHALAGHFENLRAFIAGPPPAVEAATRMLLVEGRMSIADIRYDKFS